MALDLPSWVVIAFNYAGLPWPGIDEDELRAWAASVRKFADDISDNSARTRGVVASVADASQSSFTASMAARWEHHDQLIADLHEPLNVFADALDVAADVVVAQKMVVIGAAIAFATEFAATQVGAIFTLGADEAALPEEIISTRAIVDFALEELKGALIGQLLNVAVQGMSDELNRVIGNLLSGGLQVVVEYESLKISYKDLRSAASAMRGQASETEETGDSAYAENANRDLEDPGEGAADSGFASVVQAVKQALLDLCLGMFKNLPNVFAQIQRDDANAFEDAADRFSGQDNTSGNDAPHDDGQGPSADPSVAPAPVGPDTVVPEGSPPAVVDPASNINRSAVNTTVDPIRQARHVLGTPEHGQNTAKGYVNSVQDAQKVLDSFHDGTAEVLGTSNAGHIKVRVSEVTGFNNNPANDYYNQPTHVFLIKGTRRVSIVPTSPVVLCISMKTSN